MTKIGFAAAALAALLLSGCVSPEQHFNQARDFEAAGRYDEAARAYIAALKGDSNYPGARAGALETGARAIDGHLRAASSAEASRDYRAAAASFGRIDSLVALASGVGVVLPLDPGYAGRRRALFDRGIEETIADAGRLGAQGRWENAISLYEQAETQFDPDGRQLDILQDARYHTLLAWGEADLRAGNPQSAMEKADRALQIYGPSSAAGRAAAEFRERAMEAARVYVAALPAWPDEALGGRVSPEFLREFNDSLARDHWSRPPELVAMIEPRAVRQELRQRRLERVVLGDRRAADVGDGLDADLVVVLWIDRYSLEDVGGETPRQTTTSNGRQATYMLFEGKRRLTARAAYRIVDVATSREIERGHTEVRDDSPLTRARYSGDVGRLKLTDRERAWFDGNRIAGIDTQLMGSVARKLAENLSREVYRKLERATP